MKAALKPGLSHELKFRVPDTKTVPHLYPESPEFQAMPEVFATGFMVGLIEWACILAVNPHLDWPTEQTHPAELLEQVAAAWSDMGLPGEMPTG